jgi:hypothetical protein
MLSKGARYDEYRNMLYAAIPTMTDKIKRYVDVAWKQCPETTIRGMYGHQDKYKLVH